MGGDVRERQRRGSSRGRTRSSRNARCRRRARVGASPPGRRRSARRRYGSGCRSAWNLTIAQRIGIIPSLMEALMRNCTGYLLLALLGVCLLAFPSLAATLELHHALGEADQDGHQHSAADLCSWVQSHTSSSIVGGAPALVSQPALPAPETPYIDRLVENLLLTALPARAPPSLSL